MKKMLIKTIPLFFMLIIFLGFQTEVMALSVPSGSGEIEGVTSIFESVWGTMKLIFQILAIIAIITTGLRYMYSSPDKKADIKTQSIILLIGSIIVFGAEDIVNFIVKITEEVFK